MARVGRCLIRKPSPQKVWPANEVALWHEPQPETQPRWPSKRARHQAPPTWPQSVSYGQQSHVMSSGDNCEWVIFPGIASKATQSNQTSSSHSAQMSDGVCSLDDGQGLVKCPSPTWCGGFVAAGIDCPYEAELDPHDGTLASVAEAVAAPRAPHTRIACRWLSETARLRACMVRAHNWM
jgi:hypothetical protein